MFPSYGRKRKGHQMKRISRWLCGCLYIGAGLNHFVNSSFYVGIMPPYLPWHMGLVLASGIAEIILGAMLLVDRFRVFAAWGLVALLIAVFPANLHMALHPELYPWASPVGLWLRLPLQGFLILWVMWYTRPEPSSIPKSKR
ncbi:MAG: DoxX family membrane protein [Aphanothece saxicola GSE-SYN-MK-01-06B]|nr:DoxX family membrane protein [Aphanothece saxicola GSE-SYN-MK-01-06B]